MEKSYLYLVKDKTSLSFYIDGDLQFSSEDEFIYHELLAVPALALASSRFEGEALKILICGGGDGLVARDLLRSEEVIEQVDLVEINPQVIELAQKEFPELNRNSLASPKVKPIIEDAFEFLSHSESAAYHLIICDFTHPNLPSDEKVFSHEWFKLIAKSLKNNGIIAVNGTSVENASMAFWSLHQSLLSGGFSSLPLHVHIPSFSKHHYGEWGFFLASPRRIVRREIQDLSLPPGLKYFTKEKLEKAARFPAPVAFWRAKALMSTMDSPQICFSQWNAQPPYSAASQVVPESKIISASSLSYQEKEIDFLEENDTWNGLIPTKNPMALESFAAQFLAHLKNRQEWEDIKYPVLHGDVSSSLMKTWYGFGDKMFSHLNYGTVIAQLLKENKLPNKIKDELSLLQANLEKNHSREVEDIKNRKGLTSLNILCLSIFFAAYFSNADLAFAKGFSGSHWGGSVGYRGDESFLKELGMIMIAAGFACTLDSDED